MKEDLQISTVANTGAVRENCSLSSEACNVESLSDITVGPYTVNHTAAFFGYCTYQNLKIEITATDGFNKTQQQLFATCKVGSTLCGEDSGPRFLGQFNEVIMRELPFTSIGLQKYARHFRILATKFPKSPGVFPPQAAALPTW